MYLPPDMDSLMMVVVTKAEVDAAVAEVVVDVGVVEEDEKSLLEVVDILELVRPAHTP